jgi:hypothetical protein
VELHVATDHPEPCEADPSPVDMDVQARNRAMSYGCPPLDHEKIVVDLSSVARFVDVALKPRTRHRVNPIPDNRRSARTRPRDYLDAQIAERPMGEIDGRDPSTGDGNAGLMKVLADIGAGFPERRFHRSSVVENDLDLGHRALTDQCPPIERNRLAGYGQSVGPVKRALRRLLVQGSAAGCLEC